MQLTKTFRFQRRSFVTGEIGRAFRTALDRMGFNDPDETLTLRETLPDTTEAERSVPRSELDTICDPETHRVSFGSLSREGEQYAHVAFAGYGSECSLYVSGSQSDLDAASAAFVETLALLPWDPDHNADGGGPVLVFDPVDLGRRLDELEKQLLQANRRLRCFLSYRFSETSELIAPRVTRFLTLLGVEVLSGATYEPRRVAEKVLSRLRQPLDLLVLLVTADGESMWTRDEIGAAIHRGLPLIPLVEDGANFDPGLFADIEYVRFAPGHIGDAFLKLLEGVCFVREQQNQPADGATTDPQPG